MPGRTRKAKSPAKKLEPPQGIAAAKASTSRKKAASPAPPPPVAKKSANKQPSVKAENKNESTAPAKKRQKAQLLSVDNFIPPAADLVLTCGSGDVGQLGHGEDVTLAKRPRVVKSFPDNTKFLQVVAGGMHTVVLTSAFEVFTCGCNDQGALGRVCYDDDGNQADKDEDFVFRKVGFPEGTSDLIMISAGDSHSAALTRGGSVFIWGTFRDKSGTFGLALEDHHNRRIMEVVKEPFLLSSKNDRVVVKIASGNDHIAMLTNNGQIFTSGAGDAGQLGRLSEHSRDRAVGLRTVEKLMTPAPIRIKQPVIFADLWCATYCCFARSVDGQIYVWGLNNYRQLGVTPDDPESTDIHYPLPSQQFTSAKVWKGFAGDHHILAVDNSGTCYGIGRGADCKLGQGADNNADSEAPVEISSNGAVGVAASTGTSFYWDNQGRGFAWAFNNDGELGLGVDEESVVEKPKEIEIRSVQGGCRIAQISANSQHTVFLAYRIPEGDGGHVRNAA